MRGTSEPQARDFLYLPPREMLLFDPEKDERLPTPLHEHGLVDADALIHLVKSVVVPEFTWERSEKPDAHHLYWERNRYPNLPEHAVNPEEFCNLPINQIVIPRMFHNLIHLATLEPEVPSEEVMQYRIESNRIVRKLFRTARLSVALTRARYMPEDKLQRGSDYHLWQFLVEVEEAKKLPPEFQIVNLAELNPEKPEDLHSLASSLGRAVVSANRTVDIKSGSAPNLLAA